jgi:SAM-dependent methyltransferase
LTPRFTSTDLEMDWEQRYRTGDTPWEKGAPAPPLLEWLQNRGALRGSILVPGCGSGYDVRAIAKASPDADVVGLDFASSALDRARQFPPAGHETYQLANLFDLPVELSNHFEWVFEHTCFCAIPPDRRLDYVRGVLQALRSDGALLAIFFLNPWDPGEAPEKGGPPFPVTRSELDKLFGRHFELVEVLAPQSAYPGREGREIIQLLRKRKQGVPPYPPQ